MYLYHHPKSELNTAQLAELADRFEALDSPEDLAALLGKNLPALQQLAAKPHYHAFYLPKPGGEKRFIQHPAPALKTVQHLLNRYLQAAYYRVKPDWAHGFIVCPRDEPQPRNIYTNALTHVRGHWFLNLDIKDFFHAVTARQHLQPLFRCMFGFSPPLTELLTRLCTCDGRLPMGAPTSPVLSNFIFYFTDGRLHDLAQSLEGRYTRYADDLTFSFPRPPSAEFTDLARMILLKQGFVLNEKKVRLQGRLDCPEITGLVIGKGNRPVLSKSFLKTLKREIAIYHWLTAEAVQKRGLFPYWFFDQFRKSLAGQVEFAGYILGRSDRTYKKLAARLAWG